MAEGKAGTFHAVSVSSSFEPLVLKTIASLGGGSLRQITGERTPQAVALELLAELTQPVIRDLKVEFRGIRVARVYPAAAAQSGRPARSRSSWAAICPRAPTRRAKWWSPATLRASRCGSAARCR